MTVGQVRLASFDYSHVEYIDKDSPNEVELGGDEESDNKAMNDLGFPMLPVQGG